MDVVAQALLEKRRHQALAAAAHFVVITLQRKVLRNDEEFLDSLRLCRDALDELGLLDAYRDRRQRLTVRALAPRLHRAGRPSRKNKPGASIEKDKP